MNLNEVTQRKLERYQESYLEKGEGQRSVAAFNRIIIEAAVEAGIAEGVPDDLGDLSPRAVKAMTERIAEHIKTATDPLPGEA